jgi:hypothetical protein
MPCWKPPTYIRNIEKGKERENLGTSTFFWDVTESETTQG